jgi:hypothetical protein
MIIRQPKLTAVMIIGPITFLITAAILITGYFRATRAVDPRVMMEFNNRVTANRISPRQIAIPTMISGEVAHTADRIGEATALALAASLYAASEQIRGRTPRGVRDLLGGLAARNLLPPELSFTQAEGTLVSPYGNLSVRYRPVPLAIEIVSIGNKPDNGPALILRIPDEAFKQGETKLFVANSLSSVRVPAPFAPAPEVIALGWSPERLRAFK